MADEDFIEKEFEQKVAEIEEEVRNHTYEYLKKDCSRERIAEKGWKPNVIKSKIVK